MAKYCVNTPTETANRCNTYSLPHSTQSHCMQSYYVCQSYTTWTHTTVHVVLLCLPVLHYMDSYYSTCSPTMSASPTLHGLILQYMQSYYVCQSYTTWTHTTVHVCSLITNCLISTTFHKYNQIKNSCFFCFFFLSAAFHTEVFRQSPISLMYLNLIRPSRGTIQWNDKYFYNLAYFESTSPQLLQQCIQSQSGQSTQYSYQQLGLGQFCSIFHLLCSAPMLVKFTYYAPIMPNQILQ